MTRLDDLRHLVTTELGRIADPEAAVGMAAYLKADMPFYGVKKPQRRMVLRQMVSRFPPTSPAEYGASVAALWELPHREEKYLAIAYAGAFPDHIVVESVPLYRRLVVEGAWWDLVDEVASRLVGGVLLDDRDAVAPTLDLWIDDADMWLRRTAIISQLGHREHTDQDRLFTYCLRRADETEFFIRKAIGWALREYAKTAPEEVRRFVLAHRHRWSGLTYREAMKHLEPSPPS